MKTAASKPVKRELDSSQEATQLLPSSLVAQALEGIRAHRLDLAWLYADKLCRTTAGLALGDAYLLRSAVLALQGDRASAEADLRAAADVDPDAPALNRALLYSPRANESLAAAARLLRAADARDRDCGFGALARMNVTCVGLLELRDGHLGGKLFWNGSEAIKLLVRTDINEQFIEIRSNTEPRPLGFKHAGCIDVALPRLTQIATVTAPELNSLFEPASLLLPPSNPISHNSGVRRIADEPLIIVPVYDDRAATLACLESLFSCIQAPTARSIVVVDDASPDAELSADLDKLAANGRIRLLRNRINMGFAGSVNRALTLRQPGQDLLLLNADTIVPPGAIEGLTRHIRNSFDVGTATPLSNNGEDTSFPQRFRPNPMLEISAIAALQRTATQVNAGHAVEMPNGVGFCLYIRGELCDRLGPLSHAYGRGYYEDVEFCLKVVQAGYRNICATDVYVGHHGSRSFGHGKRALVVRNLRRVRTAYPSYLARARAFETADPLKDSIGRIEEQLLCNLPSIDLLLLPFDTPRFLANTMASCLTKSCRYLITLRVRRSENDLHIAFVGANGAVPQNMVWRLAVGSEGEDALARRLFCLPIRSATILDVHALPQEIIGAVSRLAVDTRLLVARLPFSYRSHTTGSEETVSPIRLFPAAPIFAVTPAVLEVMTSLWDSDKVEVLTLPHLLELRSPRLERTHGPLAVVGMESASENIALLKALAQALPCAQDRPSVVVAGSLTPDVIASLPATIHVSGHIDDEELAAWLTRLNPQAVFFADRDWGTADPRATIWAEAGIGIARFDRRSVKARKNGHCLILPGDGSPETLASAIAGWFSSPQSRNSSS